LISPDVVTEEETNPPCLTAYRADEDWNGEFLEKVRDSEPVAA
jgi:hypothetical protein